jgi:hypothetical protein
MRITRQEPIPAEDKKPKEGGFIQYTPFSLFVRLTKRNGEIILQTEVVKNKNGLAALEERSFQKKEKFLKGIIEQLAGDTGTVIALTNPNIPWHKHEFWISCPNDQEALNLFQDAETISEELDWWNHLTKKEINALRKPKSLAATTPGGCTLLELLILTKKEQWIHPKLKIALEELNETSRSPLEGILIAYGQVNKPRKRTGSTISTAESSITLDRSWWHFNGDTEDARQYAGQVACMNKDQIEELDKPIHPKETADAYSKIVEEESTRGKLTERTWKRAETLHRHFRKNPDEQREDNFANNLSIPAIQALSKTGTGILSPALIVKAEIDKTNPQQAIRCFDQWLFNTQGYHIDPTNEYGEKLANLIPHAEPSVLDRIINRLLTHATTRKSIPESWSQHPQVLGKVKSIICNGWNQAEQKGLKHPAILAITEGKGSPWILALLLKDVDTPEELKNKIATANAKKL